MAASYQTFVTCDRLSEPGRTPGVIFPMTKYSAVFTKALVFCIATGIAVPLLYFGLLNKTVTPLENVAVHIYVCGWYFFLGMFGGLHGAPAWAALLSAVLAVICENLVVYFLVRWLWVRWIRPQSE